MNRNCPNCGAPYDTKLNTCPYCNTSYLDMSCLDFEDRKPFYLKIKTRIGGQLGYITQKVIPTIGNIEISNNTMDITDTYGSVVRQIIRDQSITTNVEFTAVRDGNTLFEIAIE